MSGTADPWEPACSPSLQHAAQRTPTIARGGAPERVYDADAADPDWTPNPVGFTAPQATEPLPLLVTRRIAQAEADLTAYVREQTGRDDLTVTYVVSPIRPGRAQ